ncbi:hypothetical protein BL250_08645 [Erwinia sp. OLTSP20]|nr:DUF1418 family protein [Erwinia sp. OLFS4]PIJ51279.1 hypothetical protein BV501_04395 [Erwinia sp. OAMSP11]PIJ74167.1 hypothetical protein BK416_04685 [Erwinia sp. OLSSP12]PIJ81207.1 hypothetical protein BLD47_09530 [Erwinia sp. OLCASP19]PIJ86130.1 hypothetical protein BLD46_04480 [Erwinia sp. OLMTSP26]PIJ87878.1 hypothetical protein BLD49_04480 [Erwinia sp. OLMDSP33]PIJ92767.1 hypothetical protein BL250_08645 [Erwinia sp. OLTSP20]
MRAFGRMPWPVLALEVVGIVLVIAAVLLLRRLLPLPFDLNLSLLARGLVLTDIALMLPAVAILAWRTLRSWLPVRKN